MLWLKRPTRISVLGAFLLIACNATDPASPAHDEPASTTGGSTSVGSGAAGLGASGGNASGGMARAGSSAPSTAGSSAQGTPSARDAGSSSGASDAGTDSGCLINGKHFAEGQTDVPSRDGCNFCKCHDGELTECTMIDCGNPCVVARKLDECCPTFKPSFRSELEANECLVEWGVPVDWKLAQKCFEKAGPQCALVDCAQQADPPSRIASQAIADKCVFSDECSSNDDCVLASDSSRCCACTTAIPKRLVARDRCLLEEGEAVPHECACTLPVECGMCPAPPAAAQCEIRDSFSACIAVQ